jgi:hypothetical protein
MTSDEQKWRGHARQLRTVLKSRRVASYYFSVSHRRICMGEKQQLQKEVQLKDGPELT